MQPKNNSGLLIGLGIAEFLCCGGVFGAIATVLAILAKTAYDKGDYQEYLSKEKAAKILLIVGVVLGAFANVFVIMVNILPLMQ